ncbi:MAG: hypothetical protein ACP5G1_01440 [Nanopusillaceae archaeon]
MNLKSVLSIYGKEETLDLILNKGLFVISTSIIDARDFEKGKKIIFSYDLFKKIGNERIYVLSAYDIDKYFISLIDMKGIIQKYIENGVIKSSPTRYMTINPDKLVNYGLVTYYEIVQNSENTNMEDLYRIEKRIPHNIFKIDREIIASLLKNYIQIKYQGKLDLRIRRGKITINTIKNTAIDISQQYFS